MVDTNDEWIVKRTGIRERRVAQNTATWELALGAGERALADAGLSAAELDLILVGTATPDFFTPSVSCMVQGKLGASRAMAFDLSAACSGFVYCVDVADSFIRAGKAKNVLVICAETLSRIIDYTDRATCVLFGDGAAAAVFQASESAAPATSNRRFYSLPPASSWVLSALPRGNSREHCWAPTRRKSFLKTTSMSIRVRNL